MDQLALLVGNAAAHGDPATPVLISALSELNERRLRWGQAWFTFAAADPANRPLLAEWLAAWEQQAGAALVAFAPLYGRLSRPALTEAAETARARAAYQRLLAELER